MSTLTSNTQLESLVFDASNPAHRPIALPESDFAWLLQLTSLSGDLLDITGWTPEWVVTDANGNVVVDLTSSATASGSNVTLTSSTAGELLVYLNAADAPTGFCSHKLLITDTSSATYTVVTDVLYGR